MKREKVLSVLMALTILLMSLTGCSNKEAISQGITEDTIKVGNVAATSGGLLLQ